MRRRENLANEHKKGAKAGGGDGRKRERWYRGWSGLNPLFIRRAGEAVGGGRRAPSRWQPQLEPCQPRCPGCRGTDRARSGGVAGCNGTPERRNLKEGRVSSKVSLNLLKYDLRLALTVCFNFLGSQLLPVAACARCCRVHTSSSRSSNRTNERRE